MSLKLADEKIGDDEFVRRVSAKPEFHLSPPQHIDPLLQLTSSDAQRSLHLAIQCLHVLKSLRCFFSLQALIFPLGERLLQG